MSEGKENTIKEAEIMTKRDHKRMIEVRKIGSFKKAFYMDIDCGTYTVSWTNAEIKEDVYNELKQRDLLLK